MIKIAICDDDINIRKEIKSLSTSYLKRNNYIYEIHEFENGESLLISNIQYAVIFLDIDMGEIDGLTVAKTIRFKDKMTKIIFVTNHPNFIKQALLVRAFGYLDKPLNKEEFKSTLQESLEYYKESSKNNSMTFHTIKGNVIIDVNKILYFEYTNRKIKIVTETHEYYFYSTIKKILEDLQNYNFSCPHKAFLINLRYVVNIVQNEIVLTNNFKIPLSQKKAMSFKMELTTYINNIHVRRL